MPGPYANTAYRAQAAQAAPEDSESPIEWAIEELTPPQHKTTRRGIMEDMNYFVSPPFDFGYDFQEHGGGLENTEHIMKGGFKPDEIRSVPSERITDGPVYPPLPNSAYGKLDTNARIPELHLPKYTEPNGVPRKVHRPNLNMDGTARVRVGETMEERKARMEELLQEMCTLKSKTVGEFLADDIDFSRPAWIIATPGATGGFILTPEEQREDFINNIDRQLEIAQGCKASLMEYCQVCNRSHILPGNPLTLADRDTCFSQIPDWFPRDTPENPWDTFQQMMNRLVLLCEIENGLKPLRQIQSAEWGLHFHDKDEQWLTDHARRYGGWWKCRSTEQDKEIPQGETNCAHCHPELSSNEGTPKHKESEQRRAAVSLARQKQKLVSFMETHHKLRGLKDKEEALAMLRRDGIPKHFGSPTDGKIRDDMLREGRVLQSATRHNNQSSIFENMDSLMSPTSHYVADQEADADSESSSLPTHSPTKTFFL